MLTSGPPRAQVMAALRRELFRTLLMQRIEFFDRHDAGELTALLSVELDTLRTFVFKCACLHASSKGLDI